MTSEWKDESELERLWDIGRRKNCEYSGWVVTLPSPWSRSQQGISKRKMQANHEDNCTGAQNEQRRRLKVEDERT